MKKVKRLLMKGVVALYMIPGISLAKGLNFSNSGDPLAESLGVVVDIITGNLGKTLMMLVIAGIGLFAMINGSINRLYVLGAAVGSGCIVGAKPIANLFWG